MKIHIRQMEHGHRDFVGTEDVHPLGLQEAGVEPLGPLTYELHAGLSDGGLWVHGTLSLHIRQVCVRCLEPFDTVLHVPEFAIQVELDGKESVDLTPFLREDILLALPPYPKCDEAEGRHCPFVSRFADALTGETLGGNSAASAPAVWSVLDKWKPNNPN
jgi:uncharacterized metal-binding protein YceD (DUF177 family)